MKKDEIKTLVKNSVSKNAGLPLADLAKLKEVANVYLEIDRETNDYYYRIDIDDLADKEFDSKILSDNNWVLSLNEEFIILYL